MIGTPLRIAHIDTERTWRGGEQQAFSLIRGLTARGHKNLSVVRKASAMCHRLQDADESTFCVNPWGEWDFLSARLLRIKLLQEKIDVVHAHTGHAVALAAMAVRGTGIPFILTRRVDFHLQSNFFSRWKYEKAARIVAISEGVRRVLLQDGVPEQQMTLIHSGVDFSRFQDVKAIARHELAAPANFVLIGQIAALVPHKDQTTFLKALALLKKKFPKFFTVIVGDGPLENQLKKLAEDLGLGGHVNFLGYRKDALSILAAMDIFCLSSREEGLGTSILDAFALKKIVVATDAGGIPEMVEEGVTGFVASRENPQALADALDRAIYSEKKAEIVVKALQKVLDFDMIHTVNAYQSLYEEVIKEAKHAKNPA